MGRTIKTKTLLKKENKSGQIFDTQVLKRLFKFILPYKITFIIVLLLTITLAPLGIIRPYMIQITVDNYMEVGQQNMLIYMCVLMFALLAVQTLVQYSHSYWSGWLGQTIIKDIRIQLYQHILNLRLKFYDHTPIGRLVTRNVSDIETLSSVFSEGLAAILADILQIAAILFIMFYTSWKLTLMSLCTLPFLLLTTFIFKEKIKASFNEVRNAVANLNTFVQEHITGMNIVQIFGSERLEFDKFKEINREHKRSNLKSVLYYSVYFPVTDVISAAGTGLIVWYGAKQVLGEEVTLGVLVAFIMYLSAFFRPIRMIADRFNTLQMGIVSTERILALLDNKEDVQKNGTFKPESTLGEVSFRDVSFAYNEENYVLKNISFELKTGQTVALVGATGAGKSSIINLLNRFYEINKGEILVDGVDVKEYDLDFLRTKIGVVLQDVFLFSGSIRENITLGNDNITDAQIWNAAKLVGADKFIERLANEKMPNGLDYDVMERGATLSVGQRQLISFVRTMVYDPKIMVLDEATSSVDSETEEMIQNAISKMMKGRTSIVIAHRLSTIQNADTILVLDKGEIKESGSHEELLALDGFYNHLYQMQYKSAITN